jgi:uncharacterized protein YggE
MDHFKIWILASVFLILSSVVSASPNHFQLSKYPYIALSGYATVVAVPDQAQFSVRLSAERNTAIKSKQAVDAKVAGILKKLQQAGLKRSAVSSAQLWLRPIHRQDKNGNTIFKGYLAQRNIEVTVKDLDQLGNYLDQMLIEGATELGNIRLTSSQQKIYQQQVRRLAAEDAATKAKALVKTLGGKIDRLWSIDYSDHVDDSPVILKSTRFAGAKQSANMQMPTYNDKTIIFKDKVDVVYKLK